MRHPDVQVINSQTTLYRTIEALQRNADGFGYSRVETQLLQPAELFLTKAGDQLIQRLFTFERAGRQLALRPEFTASAAKAYADLFSQTQDAQIARWQFAGTVFEDIPDAAHILQRFSVGAELVGWQGLSADAEVVALAHTGLRSVGITATQLLLGSVQFLREVLNSFDLDARIRRFLIDNLSHLNTGGKTFILERFDKLAAVSSPANVSANTNLSELPFLLDGEGTLGGRTREDILQRMIRKSQRAASRGKVEAALDQLEQLHQVDALPQTAFNQIRSILSSAQTKASNALSQLETLIPLLEQYGVDPDTIRIQPTLARDWNYYTGLVFEIRETSGVLLAGGGRYDELVKLVGGSDVPAVGMALYVDKLLPFVNLSDSPAANTIIITDDEDTAGVAAWWASRLRVEGLTVVLRNYMYAADQLENSFRAQIDGSLKRGNDIYSPDQFASIVAVSK